MLIEANNVERVLTDIDADYAGGIERVGHGVLRVFGAPCQLGSLAGQEHGRTIPLADLHLTHTGIRSANLRNDDRLIESGIAGR